MNMSEPHSYKRRWTISDISCQECGLPMTDPIHQSLKIGWSDFAKNRHIPNNGYSYFTGTNEQLVELVERYWDKRTPGAGRTGLDKVVLVPIIPVMGDGCVDCGSIVLQRFRMATKQIHEHIVLDARFFRRQTFEDPSVKVTARGDYGIPSFVSVVCYSADALLENNGDRSGDFDWEIVAIVASDVENEPMHPLAMARNFLQKPGGTFAPYTAEQFAEAILYWSTRVSVETDRD